MQIVNLFYNLARHAKGVRGFTYGKGYEKGSGTDKYPLVWVDDPIQGQQASNSAMRYNVNVDILAIPETEAEVEPIQTWALELGLAFREKILKEYQKFGMDTVSFITLRNYYGDKAAGVRMTYGAVGPLPINLCLEFFDPTQEWPDEKDLPEFSVEGAEGCAVFTDKTKLPKFSLS